MEYTAEQAVEAGATLLDEFIPGWAERINWDELNIYSLKLCIIGQLDDALFVDTLTELGLRDFIEGKRYGFEARNPSIAAEYVALNAAWKAWRKAQVAA